MNEKMPIKKVEQLPELNSEKGIYFDIALYEHSYRMATLFSKSTMVPPDFQQNQANCMIAINMSVRLSLDPFMVMQDMYMIHGRPAMSSKMQIALLNRSKEFEPIVYELKGEGKKRACIARAKHRKTGVITEGPWITWDIVENEGWNKKSGSKWKTMPDVMFQYRAAAFFIRLHAPHLLLGMITVEEAEDIKESDYIDISSNEIKEFSLPKAEKKSSPIKNVTVVKLKDDKDTSLTDEEKEAIIREEIEEAESYNGEPGF